MKILIAGSHGMIGTAVTALLLSQGHELVRLVRHAPAMEEVHWDPDAGNIDADALEGFDAVVHLASMRWPLRWTPAARQTIRDNRVGTNRLLADTLARCVHRPRVLVCASGMGVYPDCGDALITEDTPPADSFLAHLNCDGENASRSASAAGIRVVHLRIPPVLAGSGIARAAVRVGDGRQWVAWISREELANITAYVLANDSIVGPVNPVSPEQLRNGEFAEILARLSGNKFVPTIPAFALRMLFGEAAQEFMLASRRVVPRRLLESHYEFLFPNTEAALRHELSLALQSAGAVPA